MQFGGTFINIKSNVIKNYLTDYKMYDRICSSQVVYSDESLLTNFIFMKLKAIRTAGSTADCGESRVIDCVKSATFISWQLNCQLVT